MEDLVDEVRFLFRRLRAAAAVVHGSDPLSAARRSILVELSQASRTVPAMAKARNVSRQAVQTLVDALSAEGWVVATPHPRDRRTREVALTEAGRGHLRALLEAERDALGSLEVNLSEAELRGAAETLRRMREGLDTLPGA